MKTSVLIYVTKKDTDLWEEKHNQYWRVESIKSSLQKEQLTWPRNICNICHLDFQMSPLIALVPETPFLYFTAVFHFSSLIHFNQKQRWATALKEQLILGVKE